MIKIYKEDINLKNSISYSDFFNEVSDAMNDISEMLLEVILEIKTEANKTQNLDASIRKLENILKMTVVDLIIEPTDENLRNLEDFIETYDRLVVNLRGYLKTIRKHLEECLENGKLVDSDFFNALVPLCFINRLSIMMRDIIIKYNEIISHFSDEWIQNNCVIVPPLIFNAPVIRAIKNIKWSLTEQQMKDLKEEIVHYSVETAFNLARHNGYLIQILK